MADEIFGNLPRRRRPFGEIDDEDERRFTEVKVFGFVPEGPLRPRPPGKGGPSVNQTATAATSTWSAADATATGMTLSNGGLTVTPTNVAPWQAIRGSTSKTSGKLYVEFSTSAAVTNWAWSLGLADIGTLVVAHDLGDTNYSCGMVIDTGTNVSAGFTSHYTSTLNSFPSPGDVYAIAVDLAAGSVWVAYNNTWSNGSNPVTGTSPIISFVPATVGALFPAMAFDLSGNGVWTLQPTAASQKYAPPAGFTAWG